MNVKFEQELKTLNSDYSDVCDVKSYIWGDGMSATVKMSGGYMVTTFTYYPEGHENLCWQCSAAGVRGSASSPKEAFSAWARETSVRIKNATR